METIKRSGGFEPLTVRDHTLIMKAIMEHPLQVFRYLPDKYKSKMGRPSGKEVLQAALQVNQIDDNVKDRIRGVLKILPKIEEAQAAAPESLKQALENLRQQLAHKTVQEQRSVLLDAGLRRKHRKDGLSDGMEVAARMLEDGMGSIYSSDFSFYKLLQEGPVARSVTAGDILDADGNGAIVVRMARRPVTAGDISDADGIGATAGGAIGSLAGGIGAGPGAVAGGAGASAGVAIVALIDWLW